MKANFELCVASPNSEALPKPFMSVRRRCTEWLKSIDPTPLAVVAHDAASPQDSFLEQPLHRKRAHMAENETTPTQLNAKRIRPANADANSDIADDDMSRDDESRSQASSKRSRTYESPIKASSSVD